MSDRLTPKFVENNELAFGEKGRRGDVGEQLFADRLDLNGIKYQWFRVDIQKQKDGIDFLLIEDNKYADIKHNLKPGAREICIDSKKIRKTKADYWYHLYSKDGKIVETVRHSPAMIRAYIEHHNVRPQITTGGPCYYISRTAEFNGTKLFETVDIC